MNNLLNKLGVGNLVVLLIITMVSIFFVLKHYRQKRKAVFTYGIIIENFKGPRDHKYVEYTFQISNVRYKGLVGLPFFKYCNYDCCSIGDTVLVRYEKGNPKNNDLLSKLPDGAIITY